MIYGDDGINTLDKKRAAHLRGRRWNRFTLLGVNALSTGSDIYPGGRQVFRSKNISVHFEDTLGQLGCILTIEPVEMPDIICLSKSFKVINI